MRALTRVMSRPRWPVLLRAERLGDRNAERAGRFGDPVGDATVRQEPWSDDQSPGATTAPAES